MQTGCRVELGDLANVCILGARQVFFAVAFGFWREHFAAEKLRSVTKWRNLLRWATISAVFKARKIMDPVANDSRDWSFC